MLDDLTYGTLSPTSLGDQCRDGPHFLDRILDRHRVAAPLEYREIRQIVPHHRDAIRRDADRCQQGLELRPLSLDATVKVVDAQLGGSVSHRFAVAACDDRDLATTPLPGTNPQTVANLKSLDLSTIGADLDRPIGQDAVDIQAEKGDVRRVGRFHGCRWYQPGADRSPRRSTKRAQLARSSTTTSYRACVPAAIPNPRTTKAAAK